MFRILDRPPLQHSYQIEQHKIEPQNHYTHSFKTIDFRYTLRSKQDRQSHRSNKEEQKKEGLLQSKLKKV